MVRPLYLWSHFKKNYFFSCLLTFSSFFCYLISVPITSEKRSMYGQYAIIMIYFKMFLLTIVRVFYYYFSLFTFLVANLHPISFSHQYLSLWFIHICLCVFPWTHLLFESLQLLHKVDLALILCCNFLVHEDMGIPSPTSSISVILLGNIVGHLVKE